MYKPVSEDSYIYNEGLLMQYLYNCHGQNTDPVLDFNLEGPCFEYNGLYRLLDSFCSLTGFDPSRITLLTGNMIEQHPAYRVQLMPRFWYEVFEIQQWCRQNIIDTGNQPAYHFANFIGRSTWHRLWTATILDCYHSRRTLQTFNSSVRSHYVVKDHTVDCLGLDDLVRNECDIIPSVVEFLQTCPRTIANDAAEIQDVATYIPQSECYPIQHPANLNILKYYHKIFVDIVCETRIMGNVFFVTEKTWRCIVARRPFIVVGSQHFLANLKRLGFKTFNDWWDEGYDEYAPQQRIKEIEKILAQISNWSLIELHNKLQQMHATLEHNYAVFQSLTYQQIQKVFDEQ